MHNARTALDHLAWGVASKHNVTTDRLRFPIRWTAPANLNKLMPGAPPKVLEALDDEQPYKREGISPLLIIHELNRIDKHRILLPAAFAVSEASWSAPDGNEVRPRVPDRPLAEGATVAEFVFEHPIAVPNVRLRIEMRLDPKIETHTRVPLDYLRKGNFPRWALDTGVYQVSRVIERLERFL